MIAVVTGRRISWRLFWKHYSKQQHATQALKAAAVAAGAGAAAAGAAWMFLIPSMRQTQNGTTLDLRRA